jgi:hypothetical protein
VVRLVPAGGEEDVGAGRARLAEEELELPHLVPAVGEARQVVALDPQARAPEVRREARERMQRCREEAERLSRNGL